MSISITIRHVPNSTRDALADRAARTGRSLQEYLAKELDRLAREPNVDDWLQSARAVAASAPQTAAHGIVDELGADRR